MIWVANPGIHKRKRERERDREHKRERESETALCPTQSPIWWVLELFPQGKSGWGVRLVTYLRLVPRVRMDVSIYPVLYMPSWLILG
jgi:hypothetical protein